MLTVYFWLSDDPASCVTRVCGLNLRSLPVYLDVLEPVNYIVCFDGTPFEVVAPLLPSGCVLIDGGSL